MNDEYTKQTSDPESHNPTRWTVCPQCEKTVPKYELVFNKRGVCTPCALHPPAKKQQHGLHGFINPAKGIFYD